MSTAWDEVATWIAAGAGGAEPSQVYDTPIAKVFAFEDRVLKIKKPVDFGFLDFTTVARREWAVRRELTFNLTTAPDVYRCVHAVTREEDGGLALGGDGEAVEWALEMRPFDPAAILSEAPDRVDAALADALGRDVARFQAAAAPKRGAPHGAAGLAYVLESNAAQLRALADDLGHAQTERLIADSWGVFDRLAPLLDQRRDAGMVRRCHGDLHLGNIVVEDERPILFDCIEFNDRLSEIDVLYDVAFLLMDLAFRGCGAAANRVLNAWLDEAARDEAARDLAAGPWGGLAALPLFLSVRAAVRAHVSGHGGDPALAKRYLQAAQDHLTPVQPRLTAIGGLSGSGKSTHARELAPTIGAGVGAVLLRSDEVRKRLWGAAPLERLPREAYAPEVSPRVYAAMIEAARSCLETGWPVVLDATFLKVEERDAAAALARSLGVGFQGLWMEAPDNVMRRRLSQRQGDASDADERVLDSQLARGVGDVSWRRVRPPPE